jgi:hypothetical protein
MIRIINKRDMPIKLCPICRVNKIGALTKRCRECMNKGHYGNLSRTYSKSQLKRKQLKSTIKQEKTK